MKKDEIKDSSLLPISQTPPASPELNKEHENMAWMLRAGVAWKAAK